MNEDDTPEPDFEAMWAKRQQLRSADEDRREWAGDEHAERNYYGEVA